MSDSLINMEEKYKELYLELIEELKSRKKSDSIESLEEAYKELVEARQNSEIYGDYNFIQSIIDAAKIAIKDIGLGRTSIVSLFVYYSKEDKQFEYKNIEKEYGKDVSLIVQGLANVFSVEEKAISSQAENFRRLLLNLAKDVRVILIILSERLAIMRIMKYLPVEEQLRMASEAAYLYAPLAHRLGLYLVKSEMEDISLKFKDRETYDMIAKKLAETQKSRNAFIAEFTKPIKESLNEQRFKFEIKGRPKSIHSILNKMKKKEVTFEDIYDLFAIRIILDCDLKNEKADCWQVYSAVTDIYQPNPLRMRDWISMPKTNGYESLHTTVIGPNGKWVEVQIRTIRMNEIAEKGVAAHWKYKGLEGERGLDGWLKKIREILETPEPDAGDFIDDFKLSLYSKEIFVFTPKGDLKKFPVNSSVLDFAYDIHTQVGGACTGAKVNGKVVPIRYVLQNGDKVEVLTSKGQKPKLDWLNFVETSRAQKKIRQALNDEKVKEAENGKEIIKRRFKNWKIEYNDEVIRDLLKHYKLPNAQEFYCNVSTNKIELSEIKTFITINTVELDEPNALEVLEQVKPSSKRESTDDFLIIDEKVANVDYKLAKCCSPIMGDSVFGFVTINEGIKIHRTNCPNAAQLVGKYGYRVVSARWSRKGLESRFPVDIRVTGDNNTTILNNISEIISKDQGIHLRNIKLDADQGAFKGIIGIEVRDLNHLGTLIKKLQSINGIYSVSRIDS